MGDQEELDLPRGVALAWGVATNPQRGPKRELSIEKIVETAVDIADADGLAAVSMSSVAARLGFTTMSLYRYVSAKDDLLLLMQEQGIGLPPASISEAPDWQSALRAWSRASLESYLAHPWLVELPISGTPNTPNNLAWMDAALAALESTPLTPLDRIGALLLVTGHTRWEATVAHSYAISQQSGMSIEQRDAMDNHILETLVTAEGFPAVKRVVDSGVFIAQDDPFAFGLDRLIDGIASYIESGASGGEPVPPTDWKEPSSYPRNPAVREARQKRREAETQLREAQRRERDLLAKAMEQEKKKS